MPDIDSTLYKRAFRNTENPTLVTDENYIIRDVNDAIIRFTGYDRDELIGNVPLMLFPQPTVYEELLNKLENNEPWQGYFQTETKDGHLIYGRGSAIPLIIDGEVHGYSGIFVDLTERRRYEQALQVIHRVLRHDLKNEMNILLGHLTVLEETIDDGSEEIDAITDVRALAKNILRRADKARELEQVLWEGFEQPNQAIELEPVLDRELDRIRKRFPDATFRYDSIPDCAVIGNKLLGTVFESVLENAVVHNDRTHPTVEIVVEEKGEHVIVSISDDGPGVPADQRDQIFGREEIDPLNHGQGLSLYFVDCVVDTYRGSVEVVNHQTGGATFRFRFTKADSNDSNGQ